MAKTQLSEPSREYTFGGLTSVLACNIGWGACDIAIAAFGRGQVVTWIHGIFGGLFFLLIFAITKEKFVFRDFINTFPIGFQRALNWGLMFIAFQQDNPAIAITILSFSLIVSILVFGPKLGEKITSRIIVSAIVGVVGVVLTSLDSLDSLQLTSGAILALIALPIAASGTYILRKVLVSVPVRTQPCYMYLWVGILFTPVMFFVNPEFGFDSFDWFLIFVITILGAGGHYLFGLSQSRTSFRFNAIASTIHTPATAFFAWLFLNDLLNPHQILGMVIVTAVVGYVSITSKKKKDPVLSESLVQEH